ncbi:DNA cytosine methyltransferase [Pelotomaculum propionicicum]|uniref:DNA cytosine methyltransferase n=1 Tax=Pelotomaculum propionicicum TaxID=258475 RepID=UPI003B7F9689
MTNKPSIFSFFSGAGLLDLGFENAGFNIVFVNEYHLPFLECYKYSREKLGTTPPEYGYHQGDIAELTEVAWIRRLYDQLSECKKNSQYTGFIGGPPCPDFSVGGKNRGRNGDNGKLSGTYVDLICQLKPDFFLFENVKGLWNTKKHRAFYDELKQKIQSNDYITQEKLINALEFGVPQDRQRILLIGFSRTLLQNLGYNYEQSSDEFMPWEKYAQFSINEIFSYPWPTLAPFKENSSIPCPIGIPENLTVEYWFKKNGVYNHPNSGQFFRPRSGLKRFQTIDEGDDSKKSFKRIHRWRYSPTAAYGNNEVHIHPYKARRISVAEALAIQSMPKEFVLPEDISLTNAFKTVGNGVPYLAAKAIAKSIMDFLEVCS